MDIGHPLHDDKRQLEGEEFALWVSDIRGMDFKIEWIPAGSWDRHDLIFGELNRRYNYQGRYDPFKNMVSLILPITSEYNFQSVDPEDVPNRLINRLMKEFPGASIWAFSSFETSKKGSATQII